MEERLARLFLHNFMGKEQLGKEVIPMREYKCPDCGKEFTASCGLKYHVENGVCHKPPKEVKPPKEEKPAKVSFGEAIAQILSSLDKTSVGCLPSIPMTKIIRGSGDEEEVVVILSDWQIGHKTRTFNAEVAKERVEKLGVAVLKVAEIHRQAYPLNKIHLFLLGDFIQNEKVGYLVDLSELEDILIDQVFEHAVPLLSWFVAEMAKHFAQVEVHCVRGNHGKGDKGSSEKTNWDDVIYKVLEAKFSDCKQVKFNIAREFYQMATIQGNNFLLVHGDQVRGGSYGIPLYALLQRMLRWGTSLSGWDILCVGHWHCFSHVEQNGQELIVNGTLVSDDEYVRRNYGWNSSTLQVMFGVHPRKRITWMYRLKL